MIKKKGILLGIIPVLFLASCGYKKISPNVEKGYIPVENNNNELSEKEVLILNKEISNFSKYVADVMNDIKKKPKDDSEVLYSVEQSPFEYKSRSDDENLKSLLNKW